MAKTALLDPDSVSFPIPHYLMRKPCYHCGSEYGEVTNVGYSYPCRCERCGRYQYHVPKADLGLGPRRIRRPVMLKTRTDVLVRANGMCEICGAKEDVEVGHILSRKHCQQWDIPPELWDHPDNLIAMCKPCNLGLSERDLPLKLFVAILLRRVDVVVERSD